MRRYSTWVNSVLFFAISAICPVLADGADWRPETDGWESIRQVGDIQLYRRSVEGSAFPAQLAHTRFKVSARGVFDVITDYNHFTDFVPSVAESRILDTSGRTNRVYQRLELPMLVADRHYIIKTEDQVGRGRGETIRVDWQLDEERSRSLEKDIAVLPKAFSGFWQLTNVVPGSGCEAVYSIHVEPGGKLPAWLFNRAAENYVLDVVEAVRERASSH